MRFVLLLSLVLACHAAAAQSVKVLVQSSPLAGAQYYAVADANAVRVDWNGRKLGYLPRAENRAVAAEMDRGGRVEGRIAALVTHRNPWQRVRIEVFVVL